MATCLVTRCRVPRDLAAVTTINEGAEVSPRGVGVTPRGIARVWQAVQSLYRSGMHPAIQLCVRRHGQVILDRAIGHARGNGPDDPPDAPKIAATPDTLFDIYSASKAITAMVIHLLDQQRRLHVEDRVCDYIPEFGTNRKQWITIRHLLTHRAGLPNLPPEAMRLDLLDHPDQILGMLCAAKPIWRPGRVLAYHAITGGFLLGEIVRRVTGENIRTFLHREILRPLGFRWTNYGVKASDVRRVALSYFTGPPPLPPLSTMLRRTLGVDIREATRLSNDPRYLTAIVPAGNVITTAGELSRFFQLLLNQGSLDGVRIFEPRTVHRATAEQSYLEFDLSLGLPLRYSMGFMLGGQWLSLYGPDTRYAFGHLGFTNVIGWADPERQVAAALLTSGKPLVYPALYHVYDILRQIGLACSKVEQRTHQGSGLRRVTAAAQSALPAKKARRPAVSAPERTRAASARSEPAMSPRRPTTRSRGQGRRSRREPTPRQP